MADLSRMSDTDLMKAAKMDIPTAIKSVSKRFDVPEDLLHKMVKTESGGNQSAVSPKGARGIMQLMPGTAKELGVNLNDPIENIYGGAKYLKQQKEKFGSWERALWAYNAGPGKVEAHVMPIATRKYLKDIAGSTPQQIDLARMSNEDLTKLAKKRGIEANGKVTQGEQPPQQPKEPELSTGQKIAKAVAPYSKHVLPFVGGTLGGIVAAPANLVAPGVSEAVGVALGGGLGMQLDRMLQKYAGTKQEPTQGERVAGKQVGPWLDAGADVATMLGAGALAPELMAAKPGLQVLGSPGAKEVGKAAAASAESALGRRLLSQKTEVPLTPAQIGQSKGTTFVEAQLRKNMWSADDVAAFDSEQQKALQDYSRSVQKENFGGTNDPVSAGTAVKDSAWDRVTKFRQRGSKLYDEVGVPAETPVDTKALSSAATEHIEELGKLESPTIKRILGITQNAEIPAEVSTSSIVDAQGRPIQTETPAKPAYTWQELRSDISDLGKMAAKETDWNKRRIYNDLARAANNDISTFAETVENPEIKAKLNTANKFWRHGEGIFGPSRTGVDLPGMETWGRKQIKRLLREESPEKIGSQFFKANPNQSEIRALREAAGEKGFNEIRQSWFEDMISKGEEGSFNHNRFITAYNKYRQSGNLDEMLTKTQREGIDRLYQISKAVAWSERMAGNASGTGHMVINNLNKWISHPMRAVAQAVGTKKFSQKYFNDPQFQKKLVEGLKLPAASLKAKAIARQLIIAGGVETREATR